MSDDVIYLMSIPHPAEDIVAEYLFAMPVSYKDVTIPVGEYMSPQHFILLTMLHRLYIRPMLV